MTRISTEAWVLRRSGQSEHGTLAREVVDFPGISAGEVLVRPLYGCLEGNVVHATERDPIDVCLERNEEKVILGNAGVVSVEKIGADVKTVREGEIALYFCNGEWDSFGYPTKIAGYDSPNSLGIFAKRIKLHERQVIRIPQNSRFSLQQWAAFSLRYVTAWSNWKVAHHCWKSQMGGVPEKETYVFGWGGGVAFAELDLARRVGCKVFMLTSNKERMKYLKRSGIEVIDRNAFSPHHYEREFLELVDQLTNGRGVSIFIDNIGAKVGSLTLKALGRQGVLATSGWKSGTFMPVLRPFECINRHIHVFTHYASYNEGLEAVAFAEMNGWCPEVESTVHDWHELPDLIDDYRNNRISTYFPLISINRS